MTYYDIIIIYYDIYLARSSQQIPAPFNQVAALAMKRLVLAGVRALDAGAMAVGLLCQTEDFL